MRILLSIILNAFILYILALFLGPNESKGLTDGIIVEGGVTTYLLGGIVLGVINVTIKPILKILSFPLFFVFFGLVSVFINAFILYLLSYILNEKLQMSGVSYYIGGDKFSVEWWTNFIIAVAFFSILNMIYSLLFNKK